MAGAPLETPRALGDLDQDGRRPFTVGDSIDVTVNGYDCNGPVIDRNERHLVLYNATDSERWFLAWDYVVTAITVTEAPPVEPDPEE